MKYNQLIKYKFVNFQNVINNFTILFTNGILYLKSFVNDIKKLQQVQNHKI